MAGIGVSGSSRYVVYEVDVWVACGCDVDFCFLLSGLLLWMLEASRTIRVAHGHPRSRYLGRNASRAPDSHIGGVVTSREVYGGVQCSFRELCPMLWVSLRMTRASGVTTELP